MDSVTGTNFLPIAGAKDDRRCRVAAEVFEALRSTMRTGLKELHLTFRGIIGKLNNRQVNSYVYAGGMV